MDSDRVYKIQERAKSTMFSIYSSAKSYKSTSQDIRKRVQKLFDSLPKRTPYYVSAFLRGMEEVLQADLYRNHFEFCYTISGKVLDDSGNMVIYENELVSTYKKSNRYYEKLGIKPSQLQEMSSANGHYWDGTDKPYFTTLNDDQIN